MTKHWFESAVIYQVYPRSFKDSNGDGIGDLKGVIEKLDYLQHLGIDAIWLSPVYASPQADNGYDISNYQDIDPIFGTLEDMDSLIANAHERNIKIVMDLVVNHTSDEHPWFQSALADPAGPYRDYYIWRPPRAGYEPGTRGAEPNNWGSAFSGPAWQYDPKSKEYYLHLFAVKQPDLNWENPRLRQEIYAMMRWWLKRGIDGFRMDVINFISKVPDLPDGEYPDPNYTPATAPLGCYGNAGPLFIDGPRMHEYLQEMHAAVFAGSEKALLTVGEMPGVTPQEARLYTDPDRSEVNMVFQFEHVDLDHGPGGKFDPRPLKLSNLKHSFNRWQEALADTGWNSLYFSNHDQPRIVSRWGDDSDRYRVASATALAGVLHLHRGTPYIYQGEELGQTNTPWQSLDEFRDVEILRYVEEQKAAGSRDEQEIWPGLLKLNRDNARTPVQWDASPNAGFSSGQPWIRTTGNQSCINAAAQITDPESCYNFYRKLIKLRHEDTTVQLGRYKMYCPEDESLYVFERYDPETGRRLLCVGNLGSNTQMFRFAETFALAEAELAQAKLLLTNPGAERRKLGSNAKAEMNVLPWQFEIWELLPTSSENTAGKH